MHQNSDIFITEADFRNRYQYDENDLLGEGGFAQVYKALDKQFQEYVALKFYSKGDQGKYDVLHEMKDTRRYSHPNIIRIHDAFVVRFDHTGGHSYVQVGILEFANGGNIRDFIQTKPSEGKFIEVLTGILNGLEYLHHEKKMIHRDLSPENILMYTEGDTWIPKIADFGISKRVDFVSGAHDRTKSTQLLGKVDYMAPEQFYPEKFGINGKINTNVDLWAFGVILYELFMERKPFGKESPDNPLMVIHSITSEPPADLNEIPEPYRSIIKRCLEKNAYTRVRSAVELIAIFQKALTKKPVQKTKILPITDFRPRSKKYIFYLSAILLLLVFISGYFIFRPSEPSAVKSSKGFDQTETINEIGTLVAQKKYRLAIAQINQLTDSLRSKKSINDLYILCKRSLESDSILFEANQFYKEKNYQSALIEYKKILNIYKPADEFTKNRIDSINNILNQDNIPKARIEGIYKKNMFTVDKYPKTNAVELMSIAITKTTTIISLKLKAGENWYFSDAGKSGAYFIEFSNRKQRINLKDITGIKTGTFVIVENDQVIQLYFNRLPENVREFNLINGDEKFHSDFPYADFIGIKI